MPKLYARYVKTSDNVLLNNYDGKLLYPYHYDTVIEDNKGTIIAHYSWYRETKPTRRNKYIMKNGVKRRITWI